MKEMNSAPTDQDRAQPSSLDTEQCRSLVERIVASEHLRRSSRLTEFLRHVCDQTLNGREDQLSEQEIGTVVFQRSEGYDTNLDNIVRVNATELRKRIELYFGEEGKVEPILLTIPRGAYKPVFHARKPAPASSADPAPESSTQTETAPESPSAQSQPIWKMIAGVLAVSCLLLAVVCLCLFLANNSLHRRLSPWTASPELRQFWTPFLHESNTTDIVLADTTFALVEDITKRSIPLNNYLNGDYVRQIFSKESADRQEDLSLIVPRSFGSLGDFRLAQKILSLAPQARNLHLSYAREYRPDLLKSDNVILIGSRKSNPWGDLFQNQLNFIIEYDPTSKTSSVRNRHPQAGEQAVYSAESNDAGPTGQSSDGYSMIACLSSPSSKTSTLIIAGTNAPATEAAGELLLSESGLSELRHRMGTFSLHHFEFLLKTSQLNGVPINATIVAFRDLPN
jgi:hypothetical protein